MWCTVSVSPSTRVLNESRPCRRQFKVLLYAKMHNEAIARKKGILPQQVHRPEERQRQILCVHQEASCQEVTCGNSCYGKQCEVQYERDPV